MKYKMIISVIVLLANFSFADTLTLDNQSGYPSQEPKAKIAIQWANTAKDADEANHAINYGLPLNPQKVDVLTSSGRLDIKIPEKAQYFRLLLWSKEQSEPDHLTNWVDIIPNKTYFLKADHLIPAVLLSGTGC